MMDATRMFVAVEEVAGASRVLGVFTCYNDARCALDVACLGVVDGRLYIITTWQNREMSREEFKAARSDRTRFYECVVAKGVRVVTETVGAKGEPVAK